MGERQESVGWNDRGVPVSALFDDPYFSIENGLAETGHVFLAGNGLPGRFRDGLRIAELGFGTGLNLLATCALWTATGQRGGFLYTSFEAFPMPPADMERALAAFPVDPTLTGPLLAAWRAGARTFTLGPARVTIIEGDARATLPGWQGLADAWFLDGFSPAKNPELWGEALMTEVARHTAPSGTFATYTAAGSVRRALAAAGFTVERHPGYGRKRHMSLGRLEKAE